jgi:hypothetical protein
MAEPKNTKEAVAQIKGMLKEMQAKEKEVKEAAKKAKSSEGDQEKLKQVLKTLSGIKDV